MTVVRAAARATRRGAAANFTGEVFQDEVLVGQPPSRMRATVVSFTPGARTGWHAHPVGQTCIASRVSAASASAKARGHRRSIQATR